MEAMLHIRNLGDKRPNISDTSNAAVLCTAVLVVQINQVTHNALHAGQ
jgi:hypothetical protein